MCFFCVEVQKQNMTRREVARAFRETVFQDDHIDEAVAVVNTNYGTDEVAQELAQLYVEEDLKEKK